MTPKNLLSCLLLFGVACGCSRNEEKETEPVVPVRVATVRQDSIRRMINADAVLYPRDQASISPKISAPVRRFYVNRGDHVRQGQLLAVLENRDLTAAALAGKGAFDQAEANYRSTSGAAVPEAVAKAQSDVDAARQALDAAQKLLASRQKLFEEGALARRLVDEARVAHAQAQSQFDTAQEHLRALQRVGKEEQIRGAAAQVEAARGQYQAAQAQVAYSQIRSPIAGVVADRPMYAGEMASAGAPLLTVMDVSEVVARASVTQSEAAFLRVGLPAAITETGSAQPLPGKVIVVSPAADPSSTTLQVWVRAANPGERLKPGLTVHVAIAAETVANALVIPPAAVLPGPQGDTIVMVVDPNSLAHERKVLIGIREPDKVQVVSGAAPGDRVIVSGGVGLPDGSRVKVMKPGEQSGEEAATRTGEK